MAEEPHLLAEWRRASRGGEGTGDSSEPFEVRHRKDRNLRRHRGEEENFFRNTCRHGGRRTVGAFENDLDLRARSVPAVRTFSSAEAQHITSSSRRRRFGGCRRPGKSENRGRFGSDHSSLGCPCGVGSPFAFGKPTMRAPAAAKLRDVISTFSKPLRQTLSFRAAQPRAAVVRRRWQAFGQRVHQSGPVDSRRRDPAFGGGLPVTQASDSSSRC